MGVSVGVDWMRGPSDVQFAATRPDMRESGRSPNAMAGVAGYGYFPLVYDDLIANKGSATYTKMRHDSDVKAALAIKSGGVFAKGWELAPAIEEGEDGYEAAEEQRAFVQDCFDSMPGSVDGILKEIVRDGLAYGTGITELNWMLRADGMIGYASLKPKDPTYYYADLDSFDNMTALWLRGVIGGDIQLDPAKFAIFTWESEHAQPWGLSDLRAAYKYWWAKDKCIQFWLIFLEKFGSPTAVGKFPRGTSSDAQAALLSVLESIQQETAITIPDDQVIELLEAQARGGDGGYHGALEWFGAQIVRSIIGNTLTTGEGARVGSMALGQVHQDVLELYIKELKRGVEEYADEKLIRPLVDYNFATPMYPNFSLLIDDKDITSLSAVFYQLIQGEVVDPEIDNAMIREQLGLPARTQEQQAMLEARKAEEKARFEESMSVRDLSREDKEQDDGV